MSERERHHHHHRSAHHDHAHHGHDPAPGKRTLVDDLAAPSASAVLPRIELGESTNMSPAEPNMSMPEPNMSMPDEHHAPLPAPVHVDGDGEAPEKVVATPAPPAAKPKAKPGKELYAAGGKLSKEHLHRFDLSAAEYAFKQEVYDAAVARLGSKIYGGVAPDELGSIEGKQVRKEVIGPLGDMLGRMRADMKAGTAVGNHPVGNATGIHIVSGYRSPEYDRGLWDKYFQKYLHATSGARAETGDPFGKQSVQLLVVYIGDKKAAPGGSNHSNGIAVDLQIELGGQRVNNTFGDQKQWRASWQFAWLEANAHSHSFWNYKKEAWHWDYKPGGPK